MLNEKRMRLFIADLRSDKYKQARTVLECTSPPEYAGVCCLGGMTRTAMEHGLVLEEVSVASVNDGRTKTRFGGDYGETVFLPGIVADWYGLQCGNSSDPRLNVPAKYQGRVNPNDETEILGEQAHATELNDHYKLTLAEIADCFEYTFVPEDYKED